MSKHERISDVAVSAVPYTLSYVLRYTTLSKVGHCDSSAVSVPLGILAFQPSLVALPAVIVWLLHEHIVMHQLYNEFYCKLEASRCQPAGWRLPNRYIDIGDAVTDSARRDQLNME
jgi:hypothetical protein